MNIFDCQLDLKAGLEKAARPDISRDDWLLTNYNPMNIFKSDGQFF